MQKDLALQRNCGDRVKKICPAERELFAEKGHTAQKGCSFEQGHSGKRGHSSQRICTAEKDDAQENGCSVEKGPCSMENGFPVEKPSSGFMPKAAMPKNV